MKFTTINALSRASTGVGAMEKDLHERDRVGVQDFVLLEDFQSEDAFIDNLRKRFRENLIYTYIGQVLVSMNPYKNLPIYTTEVIKDYQGAHFYEAPPHVFAIADASLRSLIEEHIEQCILISGESGSGKTEASKKVLQFIAASTTNKSTVENVKDKLLQSNPVLEAFGNAKTNRNNNSSRFGKYMDITFDFRGVPIGGNILNYLLEKSRVVHQASGERNFHIFYQLIEGADDSLLHDLHLKRNLDNYFYLSNGNKGSTGMDDRAQFSAIRHAMKTLEMSAQEQQAMFNIVASVLHLGNVGFTENDGKAEILKPECINYISELLGCDQKKLGRALTHRTIDARGDVVTSPLNREMAIYARDALAKAIYDRMFTWLVERMNRTLNANYGGATENKVMGILDIYGFEIFQKNSFEQFCINFCNEKLQQLFIELTLKSEQDEYLKEGIEWVPVEYFDNKVICDLIEEKHRGIISLLDEECLRPGEPTDQSFLHKMNEFLTKHKHYVSHMKADLKIQKIMGRDEFQLKHYAGEVIYNVKGFLDKNNDLLFRDLREIMSETINPITQCVFPRSEIVIKKRPETAITQFKNSLAGLMQTLMGKQPSYIRCIKPNDVQASGQFDENIVRHQVKYLGLMENLRVRRAGFAYRRLYEMFLKRYKSLSPVTWPNYKGPAKEGVRQLMMHMKYTDDDYKMGETKIFIRFPKTLFTIEDDFQRKKHDIATIIQKLWKGRQQRLRYLKMKEAIVVIQKDVRMFLAKRQVIRRKQAVITIRNFIEGFITRNGPTSDLNRKFIQLAKRHYLLWLSKHLPTKLTENPWGSELFRKRCPHVCKEATLNIRISHRRWLAHKYRKALSPEMKRQFEMKVLAESIFKGKKLSYPASIGPHFINDRLSAEQKPLRDNFVRTLQPDEKIVYAISVTKYDRHGYKPRVRALLVSTKSIYVLDGKTFKQKHCLPHSMIQEICVTSSNDDLMVLRIPPEQKKDKGDLILKVTPVIEAVTYIINTIKKPELCKVQGSETIYHNLTNGKKGQIDIVTGDVPEIKKGTTGHLIAVVSQS